VITFAAILAASFTVVALKPVNDAVVVPYTAWIARVTAGVLRLLGERATVSGCTVASPRFAVTIYNGCNGLVTSLIFISGVLAFPASWRARALGAVGGLAAIQALNMIRIVSLYYIGVFLPRFFTQSHIFVWQSIVIVAGVALWVAWASRYGAPRRTRS